jgi:hypothetical protein
MKLQSMVDQLEWEGWIGYHEACRVIPPVEGIYRARRRVGGITVYVGRAGTRTRYNGLQGRFRIYAGGNMTGLTENALSQAMREPEWIRDVADEAARGVFLSGADLVRRAVNFADLEISWTLCPGMDNRALTSLEREVRTAVPDQEGLWSRH